MKITLLVYLMTMPSYASHSNYDQSWWATLQEYSIHICCVPVVEKPAETQTSIRLASHLVRGPNFRSGGREFDSPMRQERGQLTKRENALGVRSFYSGDPDVIT